ncbi:putative ribosomal protein l32 protein [Naviculisporaceae sp. PSN 640]
MTVSTPVTTLATTPCCPKCGADIGIPAFEETQAALLDAHNKINDLQAQVRLLTQKATAAVDRWADYEDELAKLRAQLDTQQQQSSQASQQQTVTSPPTAGIATPAQTPSPLRSSFLPAGAATRLSAFLSPRTKTAPAAASPTTTRSPIYPLSPSSAVSGPGPGNNNNLAMSLSSPTPSTESLLEALSREQALRQEAEGKLSETSREVEELSVTLFEQANEMVASERRARAQLEERVATLEKRDGDKRKRLERLEGAMKRIERVRGLLGEAPVDGAAGSAN